MAQGVTRGRPRTERDPEGRTPVSIRLRGDVFNKLSEIAKQNNRPLSLEVEARLEATLNHAVVPAEDRDLALRFISTFKHGGAGAVLMMLLDLGEPGFEEREIRRLALLRPLLNQDPKARKSGFRAPNEEPQP